MPARSEALAVVRALTCTLADYEALDGDVAANLALAVDEACTVLIDMAPAGARLVLVAEPRAHEFDVRVSSVCDVPEDDPVTLSGFSRRVLEALTDKVGTSAEEADVEEGGQGPVFAISLMVRRSPPGR